MADGTSTSGACARTASAVCGSIAAVAIPTRTIVGAIVVVVPITVHAATAALSNNFNN